MSTDQRVGVAGATGALGQEVVQVLDGVRWRPAHLVPLASRATSVSHVDYGGEQIAVDDLDVEALDGLDALVMTLPKDVAREVGERAAREGVPTVDCAGAFGADEEVPLVIPWVNPEALQEAPARGIVAIPHAAATLLASALGPLQRAGLGGEARAVVLLPASMRGRDGIEELSRQVVTLFNAGTPPRRIFPDGLAFDLIPQWGGLEPTGWTSDERRVGAEVARVIGADAPAVTLVGVPVFSGTSAHLSLRFGRAAPPELVAQILLDGGLALAEDAHARSVPRPRRVEGRPLPQVGRIRVDDAGVLHMWLAMDNLRVSAAVAVATCGALLRGSGSD